jgi:hydroxyacylglutathione hydrolase
MPDIIPIPVPPDNYIWLLGDAEHVVIVDATAAAPVIEFLEKRRLKPLAVLSTHHHADHVSGNARLREHYGVDVYGPAHETIPALTQPLHGGEKLRFAELGATVSVIATPGHTVGSLSYAVSLAHDAPALFSGDTLFSAGCGRIFEGTPDEMFDSLQKLARLPDDTRLYCGHEYTVNNLRFALTEEPDNADMRDALNRCEQRRAEGLPTLPSTLRRERKINPFLRVERENFAAMRARKDKF